MRGSVRSNVSKCPRCGGQFELVLHPRTQQPIDIMCPEGHVPRNCWVDGRSFKNRKGVVGPIWKDENGRIMKFDAAFRLLESIRHDYDKDPLRFDPTRWSSIGRESRRFDDVYWRWHDEMSRTRSKAYSYGIKCQGQKHIIPAIGGLDVRELTREDMFKLDIAMRESGLAAKSRKTVFERVKACLFYAVDNKMLSRDDIPKFPTIEREYRERWVVDEDVQRDGIEAMPPNTRMLMRVLVETGMRPGEACGLKKVDILPERKIFVQRALDYWRNERPPKNGRPRYVRISEELYQELMGISALPGAYLFLSPEGLPYNTGTLSHNFRRMARANGLPEEVTLYTFVRHTKATRIAEEFAREGEKAASAQLGNTPDVVREHYIQNGGSLVVGRFEDKVSG